MKNIIIFGYGYQGIQAHKWLRNQTEYNFCGFADNSVYKQGYYVDGRKIVGIDKLTDLKKELDISVIIAAHKWWEIADQCKEHGILVEGVYVDDRIQSSEHMDFKQLDLSKEIKLYAGDIEDNVHLNEKNLYGLSITKSDKKHIFHNILEDYPLPDGCVDRYEAEEVLEYIPIEKQKSVLNQICRVLKTGSRCRITISDFNSPYLKSRTMMDKRGNFLFDPGAGGNYGKDGIENGAVYFSTYESFKKILDQTDFSSFDWLCYYTKDGKLHKKYIDMAWGYNKRVSNESDENIYCIVVDCYK